MCKIKCQNLVDESIDQNQVILMRDRVMCGGCLKTAAKAYRTQNFSGRAIKTEFKRNCRKLSIFDRMMCYTFVNKNKDKIVAELKRDRSPKQVCHVLHLCI